MIFIFIRVGWYKICLVYYIKDFQGFGRIIEYDYLFYGNRDIFGLILLNFFIIYRNIGKIFQGIIKFINREQVCFILYRSFVFCGDVIYLNCRIKKYILKVLSGSLIMLCLVVIGVIVFNDSFNVLYMFLVIYIFLNFEYQVLVFLFW